MVVRLSDQPNGFEGVNLADAVLTANLFGRATSNLLVAQRLQAAHAEIDFEMRQVAELQRSLLPQQIPNIPRLDIAASYRTATRAGGDYYDFFDIGDGRWGLWIADVSGHGTPAAVVMAMLRTLLHATCQEHCCPADLLEIANRHLCAQTNRFDSIFATAFYGVIDPADGSMNYVCAGHNPPLLVDQSSGVRELNESATLPLGVDAECEFTVSNTTLKSGDTLLLYTDGITEASSPNGDMYGLDRLLRCVRSKVSSAENIINCVMRELAAFTGGGPQSDDQTIVAVRVQ
jgi:sigma-B regulation protein RsbU (phosphoserine phosphatase)